MKTVKVTDLKQVDQTRYTEGDIFYTDKEYAVLQDGKLDPLVKKSDLKGYVKKTEVQKMIDAAMKKDVEK